MEFKKKYTDEEIQKIINKLNKYEQSFHDTSSILKSVSESIPQFIFWKDINSVYLGCNRLFANLVGFKRPEQLIGKTDYDIDWQSTGHTAESFRKDDKETMAGRHVANKEEILSLPNGNSLITIVSKRPIIDRGKVVGVIGLFTDVTELSQAKKRAEFASKAKSDFIANMSHDLRTPITGMLAMIQDMINATDKAKPALRELGSSTNSKTLKSIIETVQRDSQYLMGATDELLQLCNEILEVVQLESGKSVNNPESFALCDIIEHNIELLQPMAHHKKLQLSHKIDTNVPTYLNGSRIYLDRVLLNLISNALKFTKEGRVKVSVRALEGHVIKHNEGENINVEILVEDTGIGIPKDKFNTIFENFSRLTPSYDGLYKGAGLGLYTVKRYIEAMKGKIEVDSELDQGTCFTITLPFTVSDHSDRIKQTIRFTKPTPPILDQESLESEASIANPEPNAYILVVEDNSLAAIAVKLALKPFNCHIDTAKNGTDAVAMAKKGDYDLILMDVGLPDFNGIEATKKIRAFDVSSKAQVPIVALTGHANNPEMREEALNAGMQDVLSKPAQPLALESVLQNYVFKVETEKQPSHQQPTPAYETPQSLVVIDWDACVRMCSDDPDFTRNILSILAKDLHHTKAVLEKAYANRDTNALRAELHRSRGGVCYLKLPQLENTLKAFHEAVKAEPQDEKILETTYAELQNAINAFWKTWKSNNFN